MATRHKSAGPDLSGLLISRPIVRGFTSAGQYYASWERDQQRQTDAERKRAQQVTSASRRARKARKTLGRMPDPKTPYRAFGGARVES